MIIPRRPRLLILEAERGVPPVVRRLGELDGYELALAATTEEALERVAGGDVDLVLVDVRTSDRDLDALNRIRRLVAGVPVILLAAAGRQEAATEALKSGAFDYLVEPLPAELLRERVGRALRVRRLNGGGPPEPGPGAAPLAGILVGSSAAIYEVSKLIGCVAGSSVTVLIRGASGTGKELVARAIHRHGPRSDKPFVVVNCAALPETLLESELFGHERGAFTGAQGRRLGRFELAHGGTLFLDEIGDMSLATQAKILRALQERVFERLGGSEAVRVDVRILAATHLDLEEMVRQGRFRSDLLYRLQVVTIPVPALQERSEDVPELVEHFLRCHADEQGIRPPQMSVEALEKLSAHTWPGNVRELEHCVRQAAVLCREGVILAEDVRLAGEGTAEAGDAGGDARTLVPLARRLLLRHPGSAHARLVAEAESVLLGEALAQSRGNVAHAARLLGLSRPTLREKLERYGRRAVERRPS